MGQRNLLKRTGIASLVALFAASAALAPDATAQQKQEQKQQPRLLEPITIRYDGLRLIDTETRKSLDLPPGTKIQLANLYTGTPDHETFLMTDENGIAPLPEGSIFILPDGQKKTYAHAALAAIRITTDEETGKQSVTSNKGVDFFHAVAGIKAYRDDPSGAIFPVDADSAFIHVNTGKESSALPPGQTSTTYFKQAGQLQIAHSLAFFAQYDLTYDLATMATSQRQSFTTYHHNTRPIDKSDTNNVRARDQFVRHIDSAHNVPGETMNRGYMMAAYVIKNRAPDAHEAEPPFVPVL